MRVLSCLSIILLGSSVLGIEESEEPQELRRQKKDISKLQAILGWKQQAIPVKPLPVVNFQDFKKPYYYSPPCNCNWRPTTRYGDDNVVVYPSQPARPSVLPAQPAIAVHSQYVVPAQPAFATPPQHSLVIPAEPARFVPQRPQPAVIPSIPAQVSGDEPCLPSRQGDGYNYDRPASPLNS